MEERASSRGRLITIEGPDGAGKSSQAIRLAEALRERGHRVTLVREPGGTALGEAIRGLLLSDSVDHDAPADALLFNAARAQLVTDVIRPSLSRGDVVICDRFTDSTLAYQGYGAGLERRWLEQLNDWATGGLRPDLTLLLDLPSEEGLRRRASGPESERTRFERAGRHDADFHRRVREGYVELAAGEPERWRVVDATAPAQALAAELLRLVSEFVAPDGEVSSRDEPIGASVRITQ
jgi:dTMP kinase